MTNKMKGKYFYQVEIHYRPLLPLTLEIQSKVKVIFNGNKWENPIYVVRQGTNKNEWSPYGCSIKICYIKTSIGCSILISDMFDISLMPSLRDRSRLIKRGVPLWNCNFNLAVKFEHRLSMGIYYLFSLLWPLFCYTLFSQ